LDVQIFQKTRSHLKLLGARRLTRTKFHTEDPQILGTATWCPILAHPCSKCKVLTSN